jgi:hypothetical protein
MPPGGGAWALISVSHGPVAHFGVAVHTRRVFSPILTSVVAPDMAVTV